MQEVTFADIESENVLENSSRRYAHCVGVIDNVPLPYEVAKRQASTSKKVFIAFST